MKSTKKFLQITLSVFKIYWEIAPKLTVGILITQIILTMQGLINVYVFAIALDKLILIVARGNTNFDELAPIIGIFVLVNVLFSIIGLLNDYLNSILGNISDPRIKLKQTDFLVSLGMANLENSELTNKTTRFNEIYTSMGQHLSVLVGIVSLLVSATIAAISIFRFLPLIVISILSLFIFKYINNSRFRNKIWTLTRDQTEQRRNAWNSIGMLTDPNSLKEIQISGGVSFLRRKFTEFINLYNNKFHQIRSRWALYELLQTILDAILYAIGMVLVINKGLEGAITVGAITFYIRGLGTFSDQIDTLSYRIGRAIESSIRIQDALELFELYKSDEDGTIMLFNSKLAPAIKLENISYAYPNGKKNVIDNLSLEIKPGEKIAIVGENGAGKTTLIKLIAKVYKPQIGEIYIDNNPLSKIMVKSWYKKIGLLFQDFNTYGHLTVGENVGIGRILKNGLNKDKIIKALKKADAYLFVNKYPNKTDQVLSERYKGGIRPSGGQWQKIAIARFFYRNAPVLIMDEPTASIDAVSEAQIFDNIYKFAKGKTVIIISHRFSTVRNADRILVLDNGKIIEDGSHSQLLKANGKYAHAFKLQAKGYS